MESHLSRMLRSISLFSLRYLQMSGSGLVLMITMMITIMIMIVIMITMCSHDLLEVSATTTLEKICDVHYLSLRGGWNAVN